MRLASLVTGSTQPSLDVATIGYWIAVVAPNYIRAQVIFPSKNRFGSIICFVLSTALCWVLSNLHVIEKEYQAKFGCASSSDPTKGVNPAIALVGIPFLYVVSFYNSRFHLAKDLRKILTLYYSFFVFQLVEIAIAFVYTWVFLPVFFESSSDVVRFSIRIFGSLVTVKIMVEAVWRGEAVRGAESTSWTSVRNIASAKSTPVSNSDKHNLRAQSQLDALPTSELICRMLPSLSLQEQTRSPFSPGLCREVPKRWRSPFCTKLPGPSPN